MDAARVQVGLKDVGRTVTVPNNDVAKLMYYLRSVLKSCNIDIIADRLVDFPNYRQLSSEDADMVFVLALTFSPDELMGKTIFEDDDGSLCKNNLNKFFEVTAVANILSVRSHAIIGGQAQNVSTIMVYKKEWLTKYFLEPMQRNTGRLARISAQLSTKHCSHCKGEKGTCACSDCPRKPHSQCIPESITSLFAKLLIESDSSSDHCSHCRGKPGKCACEAGCPKGQSECIAHHEGVICDACKTTGIVGARYKCRVCDNYDLCASCYRLNRHVLTHSFARIDRCGVSPVALEPRQKPAPRRPSVPQPAPPRREQMRTSPNNGHRSVQTIMDMSIAAMKSYLRENEVSFDGIFEKERLRKLVWETQIECMSATELSSFASREGISLTDCTSVSSRREKVKKSFNPVRIRPSAPRSFKQGQKVKLSGLRRADMNGMTASVVSDSGGAERVDIQLEPTGRRFAVKAENLILEVDILD